eukprot:TRINITY_DN3568_c0_g1_i1.p1 TRINITY_DN3568_c0_g1~~TRINITY_DN3568_c0_g1_i1.p1  ORF type:complete len:638 (-),score=136.54 TRINITY_DN3568_c0_g1_i1:2085-3998(-)
MSEKRSKRKRTKKKPIEDLDGDSAEQYMGGDLLPVGGKILFHPVEVIGVAKKPGTYKIQVKLDGEEVFETEDTHKSDSFEDEPQYIHLNEDSEELLFYLESKGLVGFSFKGQFVVPCDDALYSGYVFDRTFELTPKPKSKGGKAKGSVRIQYFYIAPEQNPLHDEYTHPYHHFITKRRLDHLIQKLDETDSEFISKKGEHSFTPLLYAVAEGLQSFAKVLIDHGANPHTEKTKDGKFALHLAVESGSSKVVKLLLENGVDPNILDKTEEENGAIHYAADRNYNNILNCLLDHEANVDLTNSNNETPLARALTNKIKPVECITTLIQRGADLYHKNTSKQAVWEIAARPALCPSENALAVLESSEICDFREFEVKNDYSKFFRIEGSDITEDWETATQFIITVSRTTNACILIYPLPPNPDSEPSGLAFCIAKSEEDHYRLPSYQEFGIGFGTHKPYEGTLEKDSIYHILPVSEREYDHFGIVIYTEKKVKLNTIEAAEYQYTASKESEWEGESAGGFAANTPEFKKNPAFHLLFPGGSETVSVRIMLSQGVENRDHSSRLAIRPGDFIIGFYLFNTNMTKVVHVSSFTQATELVEIIELDASNQYLLVPCTQSPGEETDFAIDVFCESKVKLKTKKR